MAGVYLAASARLLGIRAFAAENAGALAGSCSAGLFRCSRRLSPASAHSRSAAGQLPSSGKLLHIARHWIALGFLPPLLFGYLLAPVAPVPLIGLVILISFIPILILLPPFIQPRFCKLLYSMAGVYTLSAFDRLDPLLSG